MGTPRTYGDAIAHSFGLSRPSQIITRSLRSSQVVVNRLSVAQMGLSPRIPPEDTFIVAIYLTPVADHELLSNGRSFIRQGYKQNAMRIVNLEGEFSARISSPHESFSFYIPRQALDEFTDDAGIRRIQHLFCAPGIVDPTMVQLVNVLDGAFQRPGEASQLFIDHVVLAACAHLVSQYGDARSGQLMTKGGLSPRQASRAEAFLSAHFAEDLTLSDVALHCGLSRAHFARAFRTTTGATPHQWLLRYRIDQAKAMMLNGLSTVEQVAVACGFADQSHLTRVFTRMTGVSPSKWRRQRRGRWAN